MNSDHRIYELTDAQREFLNSTATDATEDVARLGGYLKGRADSDRPKLGEGDGRARGPGSNSDLVG